MEEFHGIVALFAMIICKFPYFYVNIKIITNDRHSGSPANNPTKQNNKHQGKNPMNVI